MCLYPEASLGILRHEWVLGLWALLTGVSEGAGGSELPSHVLPTLGQCWEEDPRKASVSVGQPTSCPAPASQLPRPGPSALLTGTVIPSLTSCLNRSGAFLHCRRESPPGLLGHFLLTSSWWVIVGGGAAPSLGFPRRNLECPLHKVCQALRAWSSVQKRGEGRARGEIRRPRVGGRVFPKVSFTLRPTSGALG